MTKNEYLSGLEKALKQAQISDYDEIIAEYGEHFDLKLQDGYSEEETAAKLSAPADIAAQFAQIKPQSGGGSRVVLAAGLLCVGVFAVIAFIMLYAWAIVLAASSVASAGMGVCVGLRINISGIMPYMPFVSALFAGLSLLAAAALSAVGTEYCRLYITQLCRAYIRWNQRLMGKNRLLPPVPMHPSIQAKKRRIMRTITLVSVAVFALCFIAALGSMMIAARSFQPWHVWSWFV